RRLVAGRRRPDPRLRVRRAGHQRSDQHQENEAGDEATPHLTNRLCAQPAAMPVTAESAGASGDTGANRLVVVPSPSWPVALSPQASGAPPDWMARLWKAPPAMAVRALFVATGVAIVMKGLVVPTPSWPALLRPQAMPALSDLMARLWAPPQVTPSPAGPAVPGVGVA